MSNHTATRLETGVYMYRGYLVQADGCLASGNDGAWICCELKLSSYTLRDLKRDIDQRINKENK